MTHFFQNKTHIATRIGLKLLACLLLMALAGCGDGKQLVPVSGKLTYGGDEWPIPGNITFTPLSEFSAGREGVHRPGSARFGTDGKYVVGSFAQGDGLMPGTYHVSISCIDPLDFSKPREELEFVPKDFKIDDLVVEAGMDPIVLNYDVPKKGK